MRFYSYGELFMVFELNMMKETTVRDTVKQKITHTMKKGHHWGQTRDKTPIAPVRALQRLYVF